MWLFSKKKSDPDGWYEALHVLIPRKLIDGKWENGPLRYRYRDGKKEWTYPTQKQIEDHIEMMIW